MGRRIAALERRSGRSLAEQMGRELADVPPIAVTLDAIDMINLIGMLEIALDEIEPANRATDLIDALLEYARVQFWQCPATLEMLRRSSLA
jgi:hypothetical protein